MDFNLKRKLIFLILISFTFSGCMVIKEIEKTNRANNSRIESYERRINEIQEHQVKIENYRFKIYNSRNDKFQDKKLNMLLGVGCKYFSETATHCFDEERKYCEDISVNYYMNPFYLYHSGENKEIYGIFIQTRRTMNTYYNTPLEKYAGKNSDLLQIASDKSNILISEKMKGGHSMRNLNDWHLKNLNCEDLLFQNLEILRDDERKDRRYPFSYLRGTYFLSKEDFFNLLNGNNKTIKLSGIKNSEEIDINVLEFNSNLKTFELELNKFIK